MSERLVILVAPDSYKGTFTSVEVASALARGWRSVRAEDEIRLAPLADGGEGTLAAIETAGGWRREVAPVHDPLGRPIDAAWLESEDGRRAIVEMATASGLSLVGEAERDARAATSRGLGELILAALDAGVGEIIVGIGGSATTDGGRGMLEALGARVVTDAGGDRLDLDGLDRRLDDVAIRVACDVTNPLLGEGGAAAVYAPQKGASPEDVAFLDARLGAWADLVEPAVGRRLRDEPGTGAAGGVGFALLAMADRVRAFGLEPGIELVMTATGFRDRLSGADVVLTGEGRIDAQTAFGKTAAGVARLAREAGVRCIAVGGSVEPDGRSALGSLGAETVAVSSGRVTLSDAIAAGTTPIERAGARIAATMGDR